MSKLYVVSVVVEDIYGATHQSFHLTLNRDLKFYSGTNDDTVLQAIWFDVPSDDNIITFITTLFGDALPLNQTHYEVNGYTDPELDFTS